MSERVKDTASRLVQPILEDLGLELVEVEYKKEGKNWFLRVYIDSPKGIAIEDCGVVSEKLSEKLDEQDPVNENYYLEVSSPGAERPLKSEEDIKRAVGKYINITTYKPLNGDKVFEGTLLSFQDGILEISQKEKQKKVRMEVPYNKVAKARLAVEF